LRDAFIGSILVTVVAAAVLPLTQDASADSLSSAQAEATQLANQIQAEGTQLAVLNERYDQAQIRVAQLDQQMVQNRAAVARTKSQVTAARSSLRQQALNDYMSGGSDNALEQLFSPGGSKASVAAEYRKVVSGNVSEAINRLNRAEDALSVQEGQLQATQTQAQATLAQAATAQQDAQAELADQQATLSKVKGTIATLVEQKQQQEQAAQAAQFQARVAAEQAAAAAAQSNQPTGGGGSAPTSSVPPPSAGGGAAVAVAAAMSQRGVPYVWAGDTPGVGFDCSGLTMWAWGQAGVSLPHSAADQYADTEHVPLSDIEPGDLLFYDEGGVIGHVTMYIGGGEMVQAPETGEDVMVTGIWSQGLVGAGRP
jgi:cell wall-associated NlpC family hydrolase